MAGRRPIYQLVCRAPHPDPRRARRGEIHGIQLGGATVPMRPTGRILDDVLQGTIDGRIRFAPTCGKCGVATEYEQCDAEEAVA